MDPEAVRTLASALAGAQRLPSLHYGPVHDTVAVSLEGLAVPAIQNLLQVVEARLFPAGSPHAESIRTEGHLFVDRLYIRADPVLTQTPDSTVSSARDSAVGNSQSLVNDTTQNRVLMPRNACASTPSWSAAISK